MAKLRKTLLSLFVLAAVPVLGSCMLLPQEEEALQPPLRAPDRIEYRTVEVTRGTVVNEVRGTGTIEARVAANVSFSETSGRLKALYVYSGNDVEEGDLLAELHNDDLLAALQRQELFYRLAEIDHERIRRSPDATRLDREASQIRLELSELDLERAREAVEKTRLYAPMSGRIVYRAPARNDDFINAFATVFSISDITDIVLRVSGELAGNATVGSDVYVIMDDVRYNGTIVQAPSLNPGDAADRTIAVIDSPTLEIDPRRLGGTLSVVFERGRAENVIVIDRSLIRTREGRSYVLVLTDGIPMERTVILGVWNNSFAEIVEGLQEGELLVEWPCFHWLSGK
jgi:RND family efflux transporter MFP subunit